MLALMGRSEYCSATDSQVQTCKEPIGALAQLVWALADSQNNVPCFHTCAACKTLAECLQGWGSTWDSLTALSQNHVQIASVGLLLLFISPAVFVGFVPGSGKNLIPLKCVRGWGRMKDTPRRWSHFQTCTLCTAPSGKAGAAPGTACGRHPRELCFSLKGLPNRTPVGCVQGWSST